MRILKIFKNKLWRYLFPLVIIAMFASWSCYPDSGMNSISDYDLIITQYDPNVNFANLKTFVMPDSIAHFIDEGREDEIDREYDDQILQNIQENMLARNYQLIANPTVADTPDVVITVYALAREWKGYTWSPGYWGGWGYPWYPGGWYPGYPGYAVPYSYTTGSLLIDMVDIKAYDPAEEKAPVIWMGGLNGLLNDTDSNILYRIENHIDQLFIQSPYLRSN